jgi:hypothetical protein
MAESPEMLSDVCAGLCSLDSTSLRKVAVEIRRILAQRSEPLPKQSGRQTDIEEIEG